MTGADLTAAIEQLRHPSSSKRRSAAKLLRKLAAPASGPPLLAALQAEAQDLRSWETRYQLIMALAECGYVPARPFLQDLASRKREAPMLDVALGDALVRLAAPADQGRVALDLASSENLELADGACRALAMLRVVPSRDVIEVVLVHAERGDLHEAKRINPRFWVAAACPGWLDEAPSVRPFLQRCLGSRNQQVRRAAELALQGKYARWSP